MGSAPLVEDGFFTKGTNMNKILALIFVAASIAGCSDANVASSNLSKAADNFELTRRIVFYNGITGEYMLTNRGSALVSPLFNHYSLDQVPTLGTDWIFWKEYSTTLLRKCDEMIVLVTNDTASSTGVRAEVELATELGINITYFDMDKYITLSKEINDFASANNE